MTEETRERIEKEIEQLQQAIYDVKEVIEEYKKIMADDNQKVETKKQEYS